MSIESLFEAEFQLRIAARDFAQARTGEEKHAHAKVLRLRARQFAKLADDFESTTRVGGNP